MLTLQLRSLEVAQFDLHSLQLLSKVLDDFLEIKDWHLNFLLHGFNLQLVWLEEACNHKLHSSQ